MWFLVWLLTIIIFELKYLKIYQYYTKILPELEKYRIENGTEKYESISNTHLSTIFSSRFIQNVRNHEKLSIILQKPKFDYRKIKFFYKYKFAFVIVYFVISIKLISLS